MPVYSTRDLIPFVNKLEERVEALNSSISDWIAQKNRILTSIDDMQGSRNLALTSLAKADEALSEIGTATFNVVANRGQRLNKLIQELKNEMYIIAQNAKGGKGYDPRINKEIDNAVSSVDSVIEDGLKLDYRLRQLQEAAMHGVHLSEKEIIFPYMTDTIMVTDTSIVLEPIEGFQFVDGEVTVLDEKGMPAVNRFNEFVSGTIDSSGNIELTDIPVTPVKIYFPVEAAFKDIPADFLRIFLQTIVQKNNEQFKKLMVFENLLGEILSDIRSMKGQNWTVDFSIMRNHQDIIKESITPKGLHVEVKNGLAYASFSYNDHPYLSHFILEKWDEESKKFVPFDGKSGVIPK